MSIADGGRKKLQQTRRESLRIYVYIYGVTKPSGGQKVRLCEQNGKNSQFTRTQRSIEANGLYTRATHIYNNRQ